MLINSYDDTITIDLNGKTLTNNGDTTISNGGFLVLEDSVGNGNAGVVLNKNYLRLRGGTIVHLIHDAPSVINGGHVENLSLISPEAKPIILGGTFGVDPSGYVYDPNVVTKLEMTVCGETVTTYAVNESIPVSDEMMDEVDEAVFSIVKAPENTELTIENFQTDLKIKNDTDFTVILNGRVIPAGKEGYLADFRPQYTGGSTVSTYSIETDKTENGSVSVSPKYASKGKTVTITATPDKGYELDELTVLDKDGKEIKLTEKDGKYTFTMPASKVTVKATFDKVKENPNTGAFLFDDVKPGDYFYDAVLWALEKGITTGTSETTFSPNEPCTRAQIVTFLWRAAGSPEPKNAATFSDVSADAYYAKAVAWAVENGITVGTSDTTFSPDEVCSRAQAVTFLSRALKGKATAGNTFSDVAEDSYYAEAVAWAAENGITTGTSETTFSPDDDCTRGQIVTFLFRAMAE